ncbi:MAG: hypothetical protein ABFQ89_03340, partial [Chloroflexota bacterium]
ESMEAFVRVLTGMEELNPRLSSIHDQTWADALRKNKGLFAVSVVLVLATLAATLISVLGGTP